MLHLRFWRALTILVAAGIVVLSLLPKPPVMPVGINFADKVAHFFAYLVLGFLVFASVFLGRKAGALLSTVLTVAALCLFFGGLIEVLQMFTGRQPEFWDLAADLIGGVSGAFVGIRFRRRLHQDRV
jgi:VanZ family protein